MSHGLLHEVLLQSELSSLTGLEREGAADAALSGDIRLQKTVKVVLVVIVDQDAGGQEIRFLNPGTLGIDIVPEVGTN